MPSYATVSDFKTLGIPSRALTGILDSVIEDALEVATSTAEGYLSSRYSDPPLTGWPKSVVYHVVGIAQFVVVSGYIGYNPDQSHEVIRMRHDDALKFFEKVAKGTITLITAETAPARGSTPSVLSDPVEDW